MNSSQADYHDEIRIERDMFVEVHLRTETPWIESISTSNMHARRREYHYRSRHERLHVKQG